MNNKGQALVEFVIIMPVFIFIALAIFDLGNIILKKYALENEIDTVSSMYKIDDTSGVSAYVTEIGAKVKYEEYGNYNKITLSKKVDVITPIVSKALGDVYEIQATKTIIKENVDEEKKTE